MSAEQPIAPPLSPRRPNRVEYLDFQDLPDHREYRLVVHGADGTAEFRFRIALAAFRSRSILLQDGPDLCYQKLLRAVAAGEAGISAMVTIDEVELASYREAHTRAPKYRPMNQPATPAVAPTMQRLPRKPLPPPAAPPPVAEPERSLEEGRRVNHLLFGLGVTGSGGGGHTVIRFDQGPSRTFVTSMLEVELLSAPHTWETGPRGVNRLRQG